MTATEGRPGAAEAVERGLSPHLRALAGGLAPDAIEEDADLARRARGGDRPAFARLYERFAPSVHAVLLAAAPRQEARDLVQEVFLLALRAIGRLEDPASIGPWLLSIARNRARDAHKSRKPVVEMPEDFEGVGPPSAFGGAGDGVGPGASMDQEQEAARALAAVKSLPEAYRETLTLRLVEGLSGPEIAAKTGMTHGSVRVNLHRGVKLLRERLSRERGP